MEMECGLSELMELPVNIPVQRQIVDSTYVDIQPNGVVKGATEVEFFVKNNGDTFIDLSNSEIISSFRIKKSNDANLSATDKVACINAIGATLFNAVDCWLGDKQVTERTPNQAFRAMVEILTSSGFGAINSWLQSALFYQDTAGQMDNADPSPATAEDPVNNGLKERYEFTKESKRVSVRSRVHADLFNQPRPLINMVPLRVKFHINKPEYVLMSNSADPAFKLVLEEMTLRLRFIKPADEIYNQIVTETALYPFTKVIIKEDVIPIGVKSHNIANFCSGKLPQKIVFALIENEAANGSFKKNPFNFQHFNLTELSVIVNGSVHNGQPLKMDYDSDDFDNGYWSLFTVTGKKFRDEGIIIPRKGYKAGNCIYGINLSPSGCNIGEYKDPERNGSINITCRFKNALTETLSLCSYLQYDNSFVSINPAKEVITNFQV